MKIRNARLSDKPALLELYLNVAKNSGGIARTIAEINAAYIDQLFTSTLINEGIILIGVERDQIIAEIHTSKYGLKIFEHILTNLTVLVHPDDQGKGYGKQLFKHLLLEIENHRPDIWRVELESRYSNQKSIGLYESLGFVKEGIMKNKTRNLNGQFEDSIMYAWFNKYFKT